MEIPVARRGGRPTLADVIAASPASIIAIPTTEANLREALALSCAGRAVVVADRGRFPALESSLAPIELLDAHPVRKSPPSWPVISFTDQLVDATNAPLAVAIGDRHEFRSSLEAVVSARFQMPLAFLCGNRLTSPVVVNGGDQLAAALRHMGEYLDASDRLGPEWLARDCQVERQVEYRNRNSVLLARRYASLVMASTIGGPTRAVHLRLISQLTAPGH